MLGSLLRSSVGLACRSCGWLSAEETRTRGRLTVLCYHRVLPRAVPTPLPDLVVSPEAFRRHCETLGRSYRVLPLTEAVRRLQNGVAGGERLAAITFDDGYQDNYLYAAPILADTGLAATFFIIAGLVGSEQLPWYDRLGRALDAAQHRHEVLGVLAEHGIEMAADGRRALGRECIRQCIARVKVLSPSARAALLAQLPAANAPPASEDRIMTWAQLRQLATAGHEIGSHSLSHDILTQLAPDCLSEEVAGSRRILQDGLAAPIDAFCYPNGDVDDSVAAEVRAAGYSCAVTVEQGSNGPAVDLFRLRRRFIHDARLAGLAQSASPTLFRMELCGLTQRLRALRTAPAQ